MITISLLPFLKEQFNTQSNIPKYLQIREAVRKSIESGKLVENQPFPSENELSKLFDVSRMTVRQAMDQLVREGLLEKRVGGGTFVKSLKLSGRMTGLTGFSDVMALSGKKTYSKVLSKQLIEAPTTVAEKLQIFGTNGGSLEPRVVSIARVRYVDEHPISYQRSYMPEIIGSALMNVDLTQHSLYGYLNTQLGLNMTSGKETIEAVAIPDDMASHLQVEPGKAGFLISRIVYANDNIAQPIEFAQSFIRGDKFMFVNEIAGKGK